MLSLFEQFLADECEAQDRDMMLEEINKHGAARTDVLREFNFNRFDIYLDFQTGIVRLVDDLDTSEAGSSSMLIADFACALKNFNPQR